MAKQSIQVIFTIMSVVVIASGFVHYLAQDNPGAWNGLSDCLPREGPLPDDITLPFCDEEQRVLFHDAMYFTVVTLATVGYGDLAPPDALSRLMVTILTMCFILWVPYETGKLMEMVKLRAPYGGEFVSNFKGSHIIVFCDDQFSGVVAFLKEYFHEDHGFLATKCVLMGGATPTSEIKQLLLRYAAKGRLMYLQGSPMRTSDLERCQLDNASAVYFLVDHWAANPEPTDKQTLLSCLSVINQPGDFAIYTEVLLPESKKYFLSVGIPVDNILCIGETMMSLLAKASVLEGFSTLLCNLCCSAGDLEVDLEPYELGYYRGLEQEMYALSLKGWVGVNFRDLSYQLYEERGVVLFAVSRMINGKQQTLLNSGDDIQDNDVGYCICSNISDVHEIEDNYDMYGGVSAGVVDAVTTTLKRVSMFGGGMGKGGRKSLAISQARMTAGRIAPRGGLAALGGISRSNSLSLSHMAPVGEEDEEWAEEEEEGGGDVPSEFSKLSQLFKQDFAEDRNKFLENVFLSIGKGQLDPEDIFDVVKKVERMLEGSEATSPRKQWKRLRNLPVYGLSRDDAVVVVTYSLNGLVTFLSVIKGQPGHRRQAIVIVAKRVDEALQLQLQDKFKDLFIIQGDDQQIDFLENACQVTISQLIFLNQAHKTADGKDMTPTEEDGEMIMRILLMQSKGRKVDYIAQLNNSDFVQHIKVGENNLPEVTLGVVAGETEAKYKAKLNHPMFMGHYFEPAYMSGKALLPIFIESILCQSYFSPGIIGGLNALLRPKDSMGGYVSLTPFDGPEEYDTYGAAVKYWYERKKVCLGLYRTEAAPHPVVMSNPHKELLILPSDRFYLIHAGSTRRPSQEMGRLDVAVRDKFRDTLLGSNEGH